VRGCAGFAAGDGADAFHRVVDFAKAPRASRDMAVVVEFGVEVVLPGDVGW